MVKRKKPAAMWAFSLYLACRLTASHAVWAASVSAPRSRAAGRIRRDMRGLDSTRYSQAGGDTLGVRDVTAAEPEYIGLACFLLFRRAIVLGQRSCFRSVLTHDRQRDRNRQAQTKLTCVHHFSMSVACDCHGRQALLPDCVRAKWCPGAGSNHRHCDFQSHALPTELPGHCPSLRPGSAGL